MFSKAGLVKVNIQVTLIPDIAHKSLEVGVRTANSVFVVRVFAALEFKLVSVPSDANSEAGIVVGHLEAS